MSVGNSPHTVYHRYFFNTHLPDPICLVQREGHLLDYYDVDDIGMPRMSDISDMWQCGWCNGIDYYYGRDSRHIKGYTVCKRLHFKQPYNPKTGKTY